MKIQKNRQLRRWMFFRIFISDPRHIAARRIKIRKIITNACDSTNIQITKAFKKRAKKIANFVLEEEKSQRKTNSLLFGFVLIALASVFAIIPYCVYSYNSAFLSSFWKYYFSYLGFISITSIAIALLSLGWSSLIGKDFEKDNVISSFISVFSGLSFITLLFSCVEGMFALRSWMIAALWAYSFNFVPQLLLYPILKRVSRFLTKSSSRRHPYEKSIHLTARLFLYLKKYSKAKRLGNIVWRKKVCYDLELLATIFEKNFAKLLEENSKDTNKEIGERTKQIANYFRSLKLQVYFPNSDTATELQEKFGLIFKALIIGNFGEIPILKDESKPKNFFFVLKRLLPSLVLLIIWAVVYHYFKNQIPKEIAFTLMLIFITLPIGTIVQLFDKNFSKKLDLLSSIKALNKGHDLSES